MAFWFTSQALLILKKGRNEPFSIKLSKENPLSIKSKDLLGERRVRLNPRQVKRRSRNLFTIIDRMYVASPTFNDILVNSDSWRTCGRCSPWCSSPFTLPTWPPSWSRGRSFTSSPVLTIIVWPSHGPTSLCSSLVPYLGATLTALWQNISRRCTRTWRNSTKAAWLKESRRLSAGKND